MLLKDIAREFCRECELVGSLEFVGTIALCMVLFERLNGDVSVVPSVGETITLYGRYNEYELKKGKYASDSVYARVFDSIGMGAIAECVCARGEDYLNEVFADLCFENGVGNPFCEFGLVGFVRSWVDQNECTWLIFDDVRG